jgi:two-component system NtrC family response regulator
VTPVGGKSVTVDVRVVAATHQNLPGFVASGKFREDLYYRLNVVAISLPPLRERLADIIPLAEHFLRLSAPGAPKRFDSAAAARLLSHTWPGNVRELKNTVERANILVRGDIIRADELEMPSRDDDKSSNLPADWLDGDLPTAVARLEQAMIAHALAVCGGNRTEAARRLNINRQLFYTKMERYGLGTKEPSEKPTGVVGKDDDER